MLDPLGPDPEVASDHDQFCPYALPVESFEDRKQWLDVDARGPRADPADGDGVRRPMVAERLPGRVHATRHHFHPVRVPARRAGQERVAGDDQPGSPQARDAPPRLLLDPLEPAVGGGWRPYEEGVVEVVDVQTRGG